ncbi:unnamed protein product [Musa banksii]
MTAVAIAAETRLSVGSRSQVICCFACVFVMQSGQICDGRMASSDFQDDLKALQKNSGAGHLNKLVEDGCHLTDAAWNVVIDLVAMTTTEALELPKLSCI